MHDRAKEGEEEKKRRRENEKTARVDRGAFCRDMPWYVSLVVMSMINLAASGSN